MDPNRSEHNRKRRITCENSERTCESFELVCIFLQRLFSRRGIPERWWQQFSSRWTIKNGPARVFYEPRVTVHWVNVLDMA